MTKILPPNDPRHMTQIKNKGPIIPKTNKDHVEIPLLVFNVKKGGQPVTVPVNQVAAMQPTGNNSGAIFVNGWIFECIDRFDVIEARWKRWLKSGV